MSNDDKRRLLGCGFAAAVVIAPFLALLYGEITGLAVMVLALGVTLLGVVEAVRQVDGVQRRRLVVLAAIDAFFLAIVLAVLVVLLLN